MKKTVMVTLLAASMLSAGGKYIVPVTTPVVPIETIDPTPWYIGGGIAWAKLSEDSCFNAPGCSYEDATWGAMVRGGYEFNQYFGIEARWLRTSWDEGPFGGTPLQHIGIFAKPQVPLNDDFNLYGLLGYGYTENLGNGGRLQYFDHDDGFSAGIGLEYDLSSKDDDYDSYKTQDNQNPQFDRAFDGHGDQEANWSLFVDYQRLLIKSDVPDLDAISFGVRYDF
jgi:OOP family OmpA-OmpF porin